MREKFFWSITSALFLYGRWYTLLMLLFDITKEKERGLRREVVEKTNV